MNLVRERRVVVPALVCDRPPALGAVVHAFAGRTMGTTWSVRLCGAPALVAEPVQRAIQSTLDEVVAQMSTWDSGSDLCRFNRAPAGTWQALPPPFFAVLDHALAVAARSGGAFDPTAAPLVDAWGFGPGRSGERCVPDAARLAAARKRCGWQRLRLDAVQQRAWQPGGLALDLSAIAKGFGVDRVAACLERRGFDGHLVEVGGELRGTGVKPDGRPWWVALEHPAPAAARVQTLVALHGLAVATSGDYRRWFEHDGQRYSHTIDPRDGRPIRHGLASVSVLHAECMAADAWSTALDVMGVEAGLAFAQAHDLAALFVVRSGDGFEECASPALERLAS